MRRIVAPWSDAVVAALNRYQHDPYFHPFTCANRGDALHYLSAAARKEHDHGILVAHPEGWRCPVCSYRQEWAHAFMAEQHPEPEP